MLIFIGVLIIMGEELEQFHREVVPLMKLRTGVFVIKLVEMAIKVLALFVGRRKVRGQVMAEEQEQFQLLSGVMENL
jgi:hypothetical protein